MTSPATKGDIDYRPRQRGRFRRGSQKGGLCEELSETFSLTGSIPPGSSFISLLFGLAGVGELGGGPVIFSRVAAMLLFAFAVTRFGLLSGVAFWFVSTILKNFPVTFDAKTWWAGPGALALATIVLLML
jgi:hypothetical protein